MGWSFDAGPLACDVLVVCPQADWRSHSPGYPVPGRWQGVATPVPRWGLGGAGPEKIHRRSGSSTGRCRPGMGPTGSGFGIRGFPGLVTAVSRRCRMPLIRGWLPVPRFSSSLVFQVGDRWSWSFARGLPPARRAVTCRSLVRLPGPWRWLSLRCRGASLAPDIRCRSRALGGPRRRGASHWRRLCFHWTGWSAVGRTQLVVLPPRWRVLGRFVVGSRGSPHVRAGVVLCAL